MGESTSETQNTPVIAGQDSALSVYAAEDVARVGEYLDAAKSARTRQHAEQQMDDFADWCAARELDHLPAEPATVAAYLTWCARDRIGTRRVGVRGGGVREMKLQPMRPASITKVLSAIRGGHRRAMLADPTVHPAIAETMAGIHRKHRGGAKKQAHPAVAAEIEAMLAADPDGAAPLRLLRDRAIIALGYTGALRRAELVALDVEDIQRMHAGRPADQGADQAARPTGGRVAAQLHVRESKTDQTGVGDTVALGRAPLTILDEWLTTANITSGAIFRRIFGATTLGPRLSDEWVRRVVHDLATAAGLPTIGRRYSGHSLRRGAATTARDNGADLLTLMRLGRWKSQTSAAMYTEIRNWAVDPDAALGLDALLGNDDATPPGARPDGQPNSGDYPN